jgi:tRNA U34 5-methylaminomethyl-2-thiouridine-forming methyltransferase MnmC
MSNIIPYITDDGSESFRNTDIDEMYHTKSGAREEAIEKNAKPLKVWEKNNPIIYDVCFGIGYNAAAAIDIIRQNNNNSLITIDIFENDKDILEKILEINPKFDSFTLIKDFIKRFLTQKKLYYEYFYEKENIKFIIYLGDARLKIKEAKYMADFVFFAPFSLTHDPVMWDAKFIKDIYNKMNKYAKLTTYSYARPVRNALTEAGFEVIPGPKIGRRSPSTIAIK